MEKYQTNPGRLDSVENFPPILDRGSISISASQLKSSVSQVLIRNIDTLFMSPWFNKIILVSGIPYFYI